MATVTPTSPAVPTTITNLAAATVPLNNGDLFVVVQNGVTKKVPANQAILPGQLNTVSAGNGIAVTQSSGIATVSLAALPSAEIIVGNASNVATPVALSGDGTLNNTGALTLNTVNSNVGSFTNANITVNAKGQILSASNGPSGILTINEQIFSNSGTYTPTAGMLYAIVEVVGGGGGGGGTQTNSGASGGGGGAGAYGKSWLSAITIGTSQTVTIGAGGTAGAVSGGNGGTGGTSSFGSLVVCTGGSGGNGSTSNSQSISGGPGGTCTSGNLQITGAHGFASISTTIVSTSCSGAGANSMLGAGGASVAGANSAGNNGIGAGGGGSGANGGGATAGGVGAAGLVVITEFCSQ